MDKKQWTSNIILKRVFVVFMVLCFSVQMVYAEETGPVSSDTPVEEKVADITLNNGNDWLQQFNNPDSFEQVEFTGSADIELRKENWNENWDGRVTLVAKVANANLSYRLVWEANDHDNRGWFTVGSGDEYSYTLTPDILAREAEREYRVVMFTVD